MTSDTSGLYDYPFNFIFPCLEVTRLDKQNISNIGVNILLAKESDTSAEDALSVLRTMIDKEIIFYDLSKSHSLSQARMVELAVKYLLDGANVDDRQHAVDLLNGKSILVKL